MVCPRMSDPADARRYLENWQDEVDSASEYRAMAASEPDPRLAQVYANLAAMEEGHIAFWEDRLRRDGAATARHLAQPRASGHRAPPRPRSGARHDRSEGSGRSEQLREAARDG